MDETSIALKPTAKVGTVARGFTGHKAVDAASLAETRARFTLMCTICNDTSVQPFLPQVLLTNGRFLGKKAKVEKLRGNLSVWTQKSAWSCHATLRRYISLLGFKLKAAAPGRDYALLLDCAPSHLHGSIKRQAKLNHIRLVYIAAGLTRCLQPADTDLFSRLKEKIAELYRSQQSMSVDGKISPAQWLEILGSSLQSILPAVKWSRAFAKVGASNWQKDVCQSLLFEFGQVYRPSHQGLRLSRRPATFSLREEVSWMFCPMCIGSSQRPKVMFGCTKANPLEHWIKLLWKHVLELCCNRFFAKPCFVSAKYRRSVDSKVDMHII